MKGLVHIARAGTKRYGWWETFCGHLARPTHNTDQEGVAPQPWVLLYGMTYISCEKCRRAFHDLVRQP